MVISIILNVEMLPDDTYKNLLLDIDAALSFCWHTLRITQFEILKEDDNYENNPNL